MECETKTASRRLKEAAAIIESCQTDVDSVTVLKRQKWEPTISQIGMVLEDKVGFQLSSKGNAPQE
jgi:hypothetical protein